MILNRTIGRADCLVLALDRGLRALTPRPVTDSPQNALPPEQASRSARLMRVNHCGEVCAQGLYFGQAIGSDRAVLRQVYVAAADEELQHLGLMRQRLVELGGRASRLDGLFYIGSITIGVLAARFGDAVSLGFLKETERQVEEHLSEHIQRLPADDHRSAALLRQMQADEQRHAETADRLGAAPLPSLVNQAMRTAAQVMTRLSYRF
jgi:ubiquinone biosynthesis monooxygenase Coq7